MHTIRMQLNSRDSEAGLVIRRFENSMTPVDLEVTTINKGTGTMWCRLPRSAAWPGIEH